MGPGIAFTYAKTGFEVSLYSRTEKTLDNAKIQIKIIADVFYQTEKMKKKDIISACSRITYITNLKECVANADIIVETISENLKAKKEINEKIDLLMKHSVIIASNTSELDIFSVMPENRIRNTVITHWFMPAHIIPLVEIVKGTQTDNGLITVISAVLILAIQWFSD